MNGDVSFYRKEIQAELLSQDFCTYQAAELPWSPDEAIELILPGLPTGYKAQYYPDTQEIVFTYE